MNKDEILKDYKNKLKQLKKHNKAYFDNDNPLISDEKYDRLKSELLDLEKNYEFLKNFDSPLLHVGHKPSKKFEKVDHAIPMLSLSNAFKA